MWRKRRRRHCEGCDGRVAAITFHEVVAEPLGRSAATEISRSWVASTGAGGARKQTDKLALISCFFICLFVCMFSRMGRLQRRWSLLSAMSLSLQNLPLSCQGPLDRFAVNGLVDRDRPGDGTLFPTASPCMSSLTPREGVGLTRPPFHSWISLLACLTRAQARGYFARM